MADQEGVLEEIGRVQRAFSGTFPVFVGAERYGTRGSVFSTYHAAHFLLVVGADGKNYLSPETKYNPDYVLADLRESLAADFLWRDERRQRMNHSSVNYACIGSRHRTVLYNDLVERLGAGREDLDAACSLAGRLIHPCIL